MTAAPHDDVKHALRDARVALDALRSELHAMDRDAVAAAAERKALSVRIAALETSIGQPATLRATADESRRVLGLILGGLAVAAIVLDAIVRWLT